MKPYPVQRTIPKSEDVPNVDYSTWSLVKLTQYGRIDECRQRIESGLDVNMLDDERVSLLHWPAINNRTKLIDYYVGIGAIVDRLGGNLEATPLHWAVRQGHLASVVLLIAHGADASLPDKDGLHCLHIAAQFGFTNICYYLLATRVDIDCTDQQGNTPLMLSSWRVQTSDPTRLLLKWGANMAHCNKYGDTAGHMACMVANISAIHQLNNAGFDWNCVNGNGQSPYQLLVELKQPHVARCLKALMLDRMIFREGTRTCVDEYKYNPTFRRRYLFVIPPITIYSVLLLFQIDVSGWLKFMGFLMLLGFLRCSRYLIAHIDIMILSFSATLSLTMLFMCNYIFVIGPQCSWICNILFYAMGLGSLVSLYKCYKSDPGYIGCDLDERIRSILSMGSHVMDRFCTLCLCRRPLRSRHCYVCNRCVARFDHHCPWIYNCVGQNNHVVYLCYCLFTLFSLLVLTVTGFSHLYRNPMCFRSVADQGMAWFLSQLGPMLTCSPWMFFSLILSALFSAWIAFLLISQIYYMVWFNLTTNEAMFRHREQWWSSRSSDEQHDNGGGSMRSPYDRGVLRNIKELLRMEGYAYGGVVDWRNVFELSELESPHALDAKVV